jgi:hypothetical protein
MAHYYSRQRGAEFQKKFAVARTQLVASDPSRISSCGSLQRVNFGDNAAFNVGHQVNHCV